MTSINQKEYLKKYLGIGKAPGEKKKKKKKEKSYGNRLKIVDDDIEASISQEIQDDLSAANEDAPLVVAVIDERPPSLRIDDETKDNLWKPIGEPDNIIEDVHNFKLSSSFKLTRSNKNSHNVQTEFKKPGNIQNFNTSRSRTKGKYNHSSHDMSPPRKRESLKSEKFNDVSSPRQRSRFEYNSLHTESYNDDKHKDIDFSPPRRNRDPMKSKKDYQDRGVKTERNIDSTSPRSNKEGMKSNKNCEDNFPKPRKEDGDISTLRNNRDTKLEKDDDNSPPRKRIRESDTDPPRKNKSHHKYDNNSPPRQRNKDQHSSPREKRDNDSSPPRKNVRGKRSSPSHKYSTSDERHKKSRWGSPESSNDILEKMKTTLSGKRAGLQNAKDITQEIISLREKEDDMFRNMSEEISGINAVTVVRDRVPRDLEEETHQLKKQKETQEKYDKWGKGLKQVQDQSEKMAEQLYEMSKPLARYADDEDLDKYLKEQEREGDPMLAYIRKKRKKKAIEAGIPEKPTYMGEFMPNRFGIKPGYRWDGVDRSNGYEKKWFEVQNKKKANLEEAHKWSTEDM